MAKEVNRRVLIGGLLVAHVAGGILASLLAADEPAVSSCILFGLAFCQVTLLGIWSGLGATRWVLRLIGTACGIGAVYTALAWGIEYHGGDFFVFVMLPALLSCAICIALRLFGIRLSDESRESQHAREGLRFTIRHLMIWTFVVACLVTLGKNLDFEFDSAQTAIIIATLGTCYAGVGVSTMWAVLGQGNVALRCAIAAVIAVVAGFASAQVFGDLGSTDSLFWVATILIQSLLLLASLGVIRAAGYRLVRKAVRSNSGKNSNSVKEAASPFKSL